MAIGAGILWLVFCLIELVLLAIFGGSFFLPLVLPKGRPRSVAYMVITLFWVALAVFMKVQYDFNVFDVVRVFFVK